MENIHVEENIVPNYGILRNHEFFLNWVDDRFSKEMANDQYNRRKCSKCKDNLHCAYCKFDGDWRQEKESSMFYDSKLTQEDKGKGYFHVFVTWNSEIVFLDIFLGAYKKAETRIEYISGKINEQRATYKNHHDQDNVDGYMYVLRCLQAYLHYSMTGILEETDIKEEFQDLTPIAVISVLSVKLNFYRNLRDNLENQVATLRKLVKLDPENPNWQEKLGVRLRACRRNQEQWVMQPGQEESVAIGKAYELRPDIPKFTVSCIRNIAETIKGKEGQNHVTLHHIVNIKCGSIYLSTVKIATEFMKNKSRELLSQAEDCDNTEDFSKSLTSIAEIFSVSLPRQFWDLDLAEQCLTTALSVCPDCSKTNHRMGIFQFTRRDNFEKSVECLARAVRSVSENFFAISDQIQVLMSQASDRSHELWQLFEENLGKDFLWSKNELSRLHFLYGCFLMIVDGDESEMIKAWVKSYKLDRSVRAFNGVIGQAKRFKWDTKICNLVQIKSILEKAGRYKVDDEDNLVPVIMEEIQKKIEKEEREGHFHFGNRGFGGRNRGKPNDQSWRSASGQGGGGRQNRSGSSNQNQRGGRGNRGARRGHSGNSHNLT